MKVKSVQDDFFKKKFLINISSNFCKRHDFAKSTVLQVFANLYFTSYFECFGEGWGLEIG